jgi:hypothetical protein
MPSCRNKNTAANYSFIVLVILGLAMCAGSLGLFFHVLGEGFAVRVARRFFVSPFRFFFQSLLCLAACKAPTALTYLGIFNFNSRRVGTMNLTASAPSSPTTPNQSILLLELFTLLNIWSGSRKPRVTTTILC